MRGYGGEPDGAGGEQEVGVLHDLAPVLVRDAHRQRVLLPQLHHRLGRDQVAREGGHEAEGLQRDRETQLNSTNIFICSYDLEI